MSMPPGMDMGPGPDATTSMHPSSGDSKTAMAPRELLNGNPRHLMSQMELVADRVEQAAERNLGTNATPARSPARSPDLSSCIHGLCSQVSASPSPPNADCFQPVSPHWISIDISTLIDPLTGRSTGTLTGLHSPATGTAPPTIPAVDRLLTALRI
jgi:hypothetical protein